MSGRGCIAFAFLLACLSPRVDAAVAEKDKDVARSLYLEGRRLYDVGEYRASLDAFKKAYLRYEDSSFLFNIGQCYRQLGDKQEALRAYRSYLRRSADADNRAEVERLISQLTASITQETARKTALPRSAETRVDAPRAREQPAAVVTTSAAPAPPARPVYKRWWLWTAVVGAAAAGVGVGLGVYYGTHHFESTLPGFTSGSALTVRF